jgi:hypothetical protein
MAYGLYLVLDQTQWMRNDFSSENKLTGTIYTNKSLTVKKNLTGYTIKVRMHRGKSWGDRFNKTASIVTAADGTWSYAVAEGEMPPPAIYKVSVTLTKSGVQETTLNRQELNVIIGPSQ